MPMESGRVLSQTDVDSFRAIIPALSECVYLNTGGVAPTPRPVTEAIIDSYERISKHGYQTPQVYDEVPRRLAEVRAHVARFVGADVEEIALLRNTTEGLNVVARGLSWTPGDEVVLSDQENPAALLSYANLARRAGVVIRRLRLTDDSSVLLSRLASLLGPRTRLVVLSHVTHVTGLVLPIEEVTRLCHEAGVLVLWDGAQALGQIPVDLHGSGCDFYSGCSYKWLLGPFGAGCLYVRRDWIDRLETTDIGVGSQEELDLETLDFRLKGSAQRYEYGARPWPVHVGMSVGMGLVEQLGVDAIRARVQQLAEHARDRLSRLPGAVVVSSARAERSSALVTVAFPQLEAKELKKRLWEEHRVLVQWRTLPAGSPAPRGLRFSLPFFILHEEIDRAVEALRCVVQS